MVTVPGAQDAGTFQRSLVNQPSGGALAQEGAFGAQIARAQQGFGAAIAGAGNELSDIALQEMIDDNKRELKEALVAQTELEKLVYFGDGTPENPGFGNLEGQAAIDGLQAARERLTEGQQQISIGMSSTVQRQRYAAASAQAGVNAQARLNNHTSVQRKIANARTAKARQEAMIDNAVRDFRDPDRMDTNFAVVKGEALAEGAERGFTGKVLVEHVEAAVSEVAVAAIEAAIAEGDIGQAKKLLKEYGAEGGPLDASDIPALQKQLKAGTVKVESQDLFDEIIALHPGPGPDAIATRLKAARNVKTNNPDVRDGVLARTTKYNAEQARAFDASKTAAYLEAGKRIDTGEAVADLDPALTVLLSTKQMDGLKEHERIVALDQPVIGSAEDFKEATTGTQEEIAGIDLRLAALYLDAEQMRLLTPMVISARKALSKPVAQTKITNPFTVSQKFAAATRGAFEKEDLSVQKYNAFFKFFQEQVEIEQESKKRALTNTEMGTILKEMYDDIHIDGSTIFGFEIPFTSVDTKKILTKVPEDVKTDLSLQFQAREGRPPNKLELVDEYLVSIGQAQ